MSFIQELLYYIPNIGLAFIMVFVAVVYSIIGVIIVRKFISPKLLKPHNDLIETTIDSIATAYTVLLAFTAVVSWQNFDSAQTHAAKEAQCVVSIYENSAALEGPSKNNIRSTIKKYVNAVVNEEWKLLSQNKESTKAANLLNDLWAIYINYDLSIHKESVFFTESVRQLNNLRELRRLRILDSDLCVHPLLLYVLLISSVIIITFLFFFGSDKFFIHALSTSAFGIVLALVLFSIIVFSYPYTGDLTIDPKIYLQGIGNLL